MRAFAVGVSGGVTYPNQRDTLEERPMSNSPSRNGEYAACWANNGPTSSHNAKNREIGRNFTSNLRLGHPPPFYMGQQTYISLGPKI